MTSFLIVDDSRYQRHLIDEALSGLGERRQAAGGREALELFGAALDAGAPFDVVILDILMPDMDGHNTLAGLRRLEEASGRSGRSRVIMLSSLDDPENMLRAQFDGGAEAYLTKPLDAGLLRRTLANLDMLDNPLTAEDLVT